MYIHSNDQHYFTHVGRMIKLRQLFLTILLLWSVSAKAQELRVLTSLPPSVTDKYLGMFDKTNQGTRVQILNKNTIAAIDEVLRGNERKFQIFWSSSPEAFEILNRNQAFASPEICGSDGPKSVVSFAVSSIGWAKRNDTTTFMPADWNDLLKPLYHGKIAMARPARSGTTHMIVEQLLLFRGWQEGWAYLLELSANLSTLTARSFGVPDGLINNRFEIGLTIDFLSQSQGETLQFRYGRPLMLVPAQIGILRGGDETSNACDFLKLLLSRKGQLALLSPEISRIPFDENIRSEIADQLPIDINNALRLSWLKYDAVITSDRYWAVNVLFDLMITETLNERRALWRRYGALKGKVSEAVLDPIKQILTNVIVSEADVAALSQTTQMSSNSSALTAGGENERSVISDWRNRVELQLRQSDIGLSKLEQRVPN
ncbi:MAG: ABC transporter substrate-binding protein [Rhodothermales bacterium]